MANNGSNTGKPQNQAFAGDSVSLRSQIAPRLAFARKLRYNEIIIFAIVKK